MSTIISIISNKTFAVRVIPHFSLFHKRAVKIDLEFILLLVCDSVYLLLITMSWQRNYLDLDGDEWMSRDFTDCDSDWKIIDDRSAKHRRPAIQNVEN